MADEVTLLAATAVRAGFDLPSSWPTVKTKQKFNDVHVDGTFVTEQKSNFQSSILTINRRLSISFFGLQIGDAGSIEELSGVCPFCCSKSNHNPEEDDCYAEYLRR